MMGDKKSLFRGQERIILISWDSIFLLRIFLYGGLQE